MVAVRGMATIGALTHALDDGRLDLTRSRSPDDPEQDDPHNQQPRPLPKFCTQ
jgi:hypothetical protein